MKDDAARAAKVTGLCPHCGYRTNRAGTLGEQQPKPRQGDLSVCIGCGEVSQYGPGLALQRVPAHVLAALSDDEQKELRKVQHAVRVLLHAADGQRDLFE